MRSKSAVGAVLVWLLMASRAQAGTFFGALSNFDAVNDTGSTCNGFEIELDDIRSQDVTYTFQFQRYGVPKITEDTFLDVNNVSHPRTFVRWMSPYDQVNHVFTQRTLPAASGFVNTGGHLCFGTNVVNGSPYDLAGCEHFGLGTLKNPSATVYRWMKEDPATPGNLIALGNPVTIPAPVWTVPAGPNPVVAAVVPVPPPPAVVPVPYLPNAEFGVAVWAKVFETESPDKADLDHLTSDDPAVPGNDGPVPNPNAVTEIEWQILQTDTMNPTANELKSERALGNGNQSVTRRYEFYKYVGFYDTTPIDGTNEALCAHVAADGMHGTLGNNGVDCSGMVVVGDYIGAQNAAADVAMPLSANAVNLNDGEVGVPYPNRPLIFGGSGGPYSIAFSGAGTLPATDAGQEFTLDPITGVLNGGTPNGPGTSTFSIHATDLVEPAQPAVDATFTILVVPAVTVDAVVIPSGTVGTDTTVELTASGGETPYQWSAASASVGLTASVTVGNILVVRASQPGTFDAQVTVNDSLGGMHTATLSYDVPAANSTTTTSSSSSTTSSSTSTTSSSTSTTAPEPTTTSTSSTTLASSSSITTTTTSTSNSTTSDSITTSSTTSTSTSTTTIPGECPVGATFASVLCRLDSLIAEVAAAPDVGSLEGQLLHQLGSARDDVAAASQLLADRPRKAHARLDHALRWLSSFENRVNSLAGRRQLPPETRARFLETAESIEHDLLQLRDGSAARAPR